MHVYTHVQGKEQTGCFLIYTHTDASLLTSNIRRRWGEARHVSPLSLVLSIETYMNGSMYLRWREGLLSSSYRELHRV